jgi:4-amino-4-deoxychorismate lyase
MNTVWLVNGEHGEVPPSDRGLAYGDGLFETMAVIDGRIRWQNYHFDRLESGCRRLGIPIVLRKLIENDIDQLKRSDAARQVAKVIVTRGSGGRGYRPPPDAAPTRIVACGPWPDYPTMHYDSGIRVVRCSTILGENEALAGLKHLCRLEQVLGQTEVQRAGADEGIMCTRDGYVMSGTMSNLFLVCGDRLLTPSLTTCGVEGVMRRAVLEQARALGIAVEIGRVSFERIGSSDEVFLTNALSGIRPVRTIDEFEFSVGAMTRRLTQALAQASN